VEDPAELSPDTAAAAPAFVYVDVGVAHGLSREALLAAAGLSEAMRSQPDARISTLAFVVLWRELVSKLPDVVVPVEVIQAIGPSALGITGQVVLRADDIAHAGQLIERFMRLTDTALSLRWLERGDLVGFTIGHRPEVVAMRFPIEVMLGTGFRLLSHAAGAPIPLREVSFAHPPGYPVEPYEALFGVPVRFSAEHSALWLPREALSMPFAGRDPIARRYLEAYAEQLLAALPEPVQAQEQVLEQSIATASEPAAPSAPIAPIREAILLELATSGAELARVARRVAMSPRTVQRRLEEAGTSYQDLVDELRANMAQSLLRDRARSIVDVAFELGYADLKGFYRAFRRWTGTTPASWRAQHG
jgi:AraC-like DNA-binding protein